MAVKREDLLGMVNRLAAAAESVGFSKETELVLHEGGGGRPYRLYERIPPATRVNDPLGGYIPSYLGFNKASAYDKLHAIATTLEAVRRIRD